MVVRFGNGFPIDSNVFRPITITWPVVIFLNHLKSSGKCHGILFPAPITRLRDMAAMALKGRTARMLSHSPKAVNQRPSIEGQWIGLIKRLAAPPRLAYTSRTNLQR